MFPFLCFREWIFQVIQIILFKFLSWYDYTTTFFFTPFNSAATSTTTDDHSIIPDDTITDILLRLPPKSLSKFMCVSKSWNQLISSPHFVNTHMKLNSHHRVLFQGINTNFKSCSLPPLFNKQQPIQDLFHMDSSPAFTPFIVGSANGLICLLDYELETYIWNPTISKSKKLLNSTWGSSFSTKYGFGYDESHEDYKALFVGYSREYSRDVVNIYSLRTDSWTTLHDQLRGIFLINRSGIFVNGKLYWVYSSTCPDSYIVCKIISFDLADETWGIVDLPIYGEANSHFRLGVVGSDLSLLCTCHLGATTSDVWILKDCGFWTKLFTVKNPQNAHLSILMYSPSIETFSIHFHKSKEGDFLLLLLPFIMISDGSTRQLELHTAEVEGYSPAKVYIESLINPLTISGQGPHIRVTSQPLS